MVPAKAHDRLGWLSRGSDDDGGPIRLWPQVERVFECQGCRRHIAVGPCFEHIDPATFVGAVCGCLTVETLPGLDEATEGAGNDGNAPAGGLGG
jgi:hypothetical protein